ncbi:ATP-grasp domain-containing protein [Streptacidiphilus rugosus]|uniref:ATP-grasp domain-containing protein n=1 Tax=Streptacidiphilus rugosus TaxID=405783 RepID=UPI00068C5279|nr:hypothetical protein [Streptacidiphilus rugosus]
MSPLYLVLNRYDDEFGEYHRFVDRGSCRLAYITLAAGLDVLDTAGAVDTVVVESLDLATVLPVARRLVARHGKPAGIVGLSEFDLHTASELRAELGVAGWAPEFVLTFRDKVWMKELVAAAGVRVPRFRELDDTFTASRVEAEVGMPVILKPRAGAASSGVVRAADAARLERALASVDPRDYECEEYVEGDIHHVDGVRRGGAFHFVSASAYVNTCLDFAHGTPLGSVLLDPGPLRDQVLSFAADCLDALALTDGPFHLELIRTAAGELVFLEVGLRPGGAEVAFIHRDLYGIDLMEEAFRATLGLPSRTAPEEFDEYRAGGWALMPEPRPLPSRITDVRGLGGGIPQVYEEISPAVGDVFDGTGGYWHVGGRFRLRGRDQAEVRQAVLQIFERYVVTAEPLPAREEAALPARESSVLLAVGEGAV